MSIDSFFAASMNPHVFTTMTSAAPGSSTWRNPERSATPSMTSVSTRFFGQPRLTKWMVRDTGGSGSSTWLAGAYVASSIDAMNRWKR